MNPLKIETEHQRNGYQIKKITGFTPFELDRLNRMPYQDMKDFALDMLDKRNNKIGTCWHNGYGVYQMWVGADALFIEIGDSCEEEKT